MKLQCLSWLIWAEAHISQRVLIRHFFSKALFLTVYSAVNFKLTQIKQVNILYCKHKKTPNEGRF